MKKLLFFFLFLTVTTVYSQHVTRVFISKEEKPFIGVKTFTYQIVRTGEKLPIWTKTKEVTFKDEYIQAYTIFFTDLPKNLLGTDIVEVRDGNTLIDKFTTLLIVKEEVKTQLMPKGVYWVIDIDNYATGFGFEIGLSKFESKAVVSSTSSEPGQNTIEWQNIEKNRLEGVIPIEYVKVDGGFILNLGVKVGLNQTKILSINGLEGQVRAGIEFAGFSFDKFDLSYGFGVDGILGFRLSNSIALRLMLSRKFLSLPNTTVPPRPFDLFRSYDVASGGIQFTL